MNRLIWLAALTCTLFAMTGCMQVHVEANIAKDGSGTGTMTMSVSETVADAMAQMRELEMDNASTDEFPLFDDITEEDFKNATKGTGVKLSHFEKSIVDGRKTLAMELEFDDLKSLSYALGRMEGKQPSAGFGIFATADGNFILKQAVYEFPPLPAEELEEAEAVEESPAETGPEDMDPEKMQQQMAIMGTLMGSLSELDVSLKINVPGDIISSNAPTVTERSSIWAVDASNMMAMDQDISPEIVFSSKGLNIKPMEQ